MDIEKLKLRLCEEINFDKGGYDNMCEVLNEFKELPVTKTAIMICPHCGKDAEAVYVDGERISEEQAKSELHSIIRQLDQITANNPNLHTGFAKDEVKHRYDRLLKKANELEVALGY